VGAADRVSSWASNVRRLFWGRPTWSARDEFAFYSVTDDRVREHRERQAAMDREAHLGGLRLLRTMDLLDTSALAGRSVLDVGAGECVVSTALAVAGAREVWATDATPKQIWAAAERRADDPALRFAIADAQDLPFEDASFDLVVANLVLHHIHPLDRLVAEVARVLRPGGEFVAHEPNPWLGALVHDASSANEAPIAPRVITAALERAGLVDRRVAFWWTRLDTGALGLLSPAFRVRARKPGDARAGDRGPAKLRRELVATRLPGLRLDPACSFADLAEEQIDAIVKVRASRPG